MKISILASIFVFMLFVYLSIKRQSRAAAKQNDAFWEREARANSVRRKSLDNLLYIMIPLEKFPTHLLHENPTVLDCIDTVESLTDKKIVNLTGWSNTDLKLAYGAANINILSEYDHNYTLLATTLQKWADELLKANYTDEAAVLMQFAVSTLTDVGRTYYLLADYYASTGKWEQINDLIKTAEGLRSSNKTTILRRLQEKSI